MVLPAFTIEVKLSDKAEDKLKVANESVIVSASFGGIPKDTTSKAY
jgi:stringent starvation protein B